MIYKALHRRTDNTMAKRKRTNNDLQNITQKERQYNGRKTKDKQWSIKHYTEGQTIQWSKEKGQTMIYKTIHRRTDNTMVKRQRTNNDLQNITHKIKDRATRVFRKEQQFLFPMWPPSCYSCYIPNLGHKWGKTRIIISTNGTYLCSFVKFLND